MEEKHTACASYVKPFRTHYTSLLPDGRVLYYRWEYVDRNFGDAQGLWTTNPDGTLHSIYWGNNTVSPAAVFDGRAIPGTDRVVSIFGSCHDRPWGAMAVLDRSRGIDSREAVERIWPESARALISIDGADLPSPFMVDHFRNGMRERYEDPFPLVDPKTGKGGTYFLVSRSVIPLPDNQPIRGSGSFNVLRMGIYLVDTFGNEILLHEEAPGCFDPMPLAPRKRPPVIPDRVGYVGSTGVFFVDDVYEGQYMQGVGQGDVVALRVVESLEKRMWTIPNWDTGQFVAWRNGRRIQSGASCRPAISWAGFEVKRILGTVPVEADGSAHFEAPAGAFVYFQLLDKNGMAISSMRSGAQLQPGETQGCISCHENRLSITHPMEGSMALRRPPSRLDGWHGPARPFNYAAEIQPIWDRHCVTCHDFGTKAGETLVLAGDRELIFNASYVELFRNWGDTNAWLNTVGLGLAPANPAYSVGSPRSRLVELLKNGHKNVALSAEEMDRIVTWIDLGGPYYPDFASANPDNVAGRAPLKIAQTERLGELTGHALIDARSKNTGFGSHKLRLSFDRPELSPCLKSLDPSGEAYREALAILQAGRDILLQNPEADRPGFKPCAEHQARETAYQTLREQERIRRAALAEGRKVYDPGIPDPGS